MESHRNNVFLVEHELLPPRSSLEASVEALGARLRHHREEAEKRV